MKIYISIFFSLSLFIFNESVKSQDFEIFDNFSTQTNAALIHSVALNDSTIIVVGSHVILKTKDYGLTWVPTIIDGILNQVTFPSDSVGYAVGYNSLIMKTIDQGVTWAYLNTDVIENTHTAFTVEFLNIDTGFVAFANGPGYAFLSTHDGGDTWQNADLGAVYGRAKLQKINDSTIYALPYDNKFYESTDYGESWEPILLPDNTGSSRDMHFFNKDTGIVAIREFSSSCGSNYYLARTNDGGLSWTMDYFECENFNNLTFPTSEIGYATGTSYSSIGERYMWRTLNGGLNWEEFQYPAGEDFEFVGVIATAFACVDQDTCYMPTNYGTIIKMTNGTGGLASKVGSNSSFSNKILISPNPNNGNFTIKLPSNSNLETCKVSVYGTNGQLVHETNIEINANEIGISISGLSAGLYFINILVGQESFKGNFVKQ